MQARKTGHIPNFEQGSQSNQSDNSSRGTFGGKDASETYVQNSLVSRENGVESPLEECTNSGKCLNDRTALIIRNLPLHERAKEFTDYFYGLKLLWIHKKKNEKGIIVTPDSIFKGYK